VQRAIELERYIDEVHAGRWQTLPKPSLATTEAAE
jgi:hypothetical protein